MINKEVSILILTCGRPVGLERILSSVKSHTTDVEYDLLVVADDDYDAYKYCKDNGINCILTGWRRDFVANMNMAVYACKTPLFVVLADDMSIDQDGWLSEALKVYKGRFKDQNGLMTFNDGIQNGRLFACGMSSKNFVQEVGGNLYHPKFVHFGGDNVVSFLAKLLGLYYYAETVKVNHHHPTNKNKELANETDQTYIDSALVSHPDQVFKKILKSDPDALLKNRNYYNFNE